MQHSRHYEQANINLESHYSDDFSIVCIKSNCRSNTYKRQREEHNLETFIHMANSYDPWYIIRSKPRMERYAAQTLANNLGLVVFLPQGKVITCQNEIKDVPFFPGYLFIQVATQKLQPQRVNACPGVLHLITFGEELASVPHTITETIHTQISDFNRENRLLNRPFHVYDHGKNKEEPVQNLNKVFLSYEEPESRTSVLLNILSHLQDVQLDPCHPEKIPEMPPRERVRFTRGKKRKTRLHSDFIHGEAEG